MNLNDLFSVIDTDALEQITPITLMANSVISANSLLDDTANHHYEKIAVSEVCPKLDAPIHYQKSAVENSRLTQSEEAYPPTVDGQLTPMEEVTPTWLMDRYAHLITCQQCEHLTSTGYCRVKPQVKPIPEAMHDCGEFNQLKTERITIEDKPYSKMELNDLLGKDEKELFHHLLECRQCDFEAARYCPEVFTTGKRYDDLLLSFDNAPIKREALLNTVIRARISGRKVFVGLDYANIGELPQTPVKPLVYGISESERPFVNHLGACTQCKPASRIYCAVGLKLKALANSNSV